MQMPRELKDKWLAALRSGKYEQGQGRLKMGDKYCCLGVLEMVADGKVETWGGGCKANNQCDHPRALDGSSLALPSDDFYARHNIDFHGAWNFAVMNDKGLPFYQIADAIERDVAVLEPADVA